MEDGTLFSSQYCTYWYPHSLIVEICLTTVLKCSFKMVKEKPATLKRENGLATMFIVEGGK
jgi:hypothetical protein